MTVSFIPDFMLHGFNCSGKKQYEMKRYYMVILMKGSDRTQDSATAAAIQKGHMEHMEQMASDKKLQVGGTFLDDGFYRGIFIFDVADMADAEKFVKDNIRKSKL